MNDKIKCNQCSKLFTDGATLAEHKRTAHLPYSDDVALDRRAKEAIWEFLGSDGRDPGLKERARAALMHRSSEARAKASESNREAVLVMMARELAHDKNQFAEYIRVAMPTSPMLKALPAKS